MKGMSPKRVGSRNEKRRSLKLGRGKITNTGKKLTRR